MAQYRCSVKERLGRGKGASVARYASYISREMVKDERTGQVYDFSNHHDKASWTGIYAPKKAPDWARDLQQLSNEIERVEIRKDAQLAMPIELSLAHELDVEKNRWMLQDFITENFTRKGYATIAAIHEPPEGGDPRNIHAHLLVSLRTMDENGFSKTKSEQQDNFMNRKEYVEGLRQSWEKHLKRHLERHGFKEQAAEVSCKSLKEQGLDREPQQHLGPTASDMERKGKETERGQINDEIAERNLRREQMSAAEKEVSQAIAETQTKLDEEKKRQQQAEEERRVLEKQKREQEEKRQAEERLQRERQEMERKRQEEWRARNEATRESIRGAWQSTPRDVIVFMIGLNERGLYVARDEKGYYAAVEKSGYAHRLPDLDMHDAVDALQRENSGLVIPMVDEVRDEQRQKREDERDQEEMRRQAHHGATLYNHASMPTMQRDALIHIRDAHRMQERERQRQEREHLQQRKQEQERQRQAQEAERQRQQQERERQQREALQRQQEQERQRREQERLARERQEREAKEREQLRRQQEVERQRQQAESSRASQVAAAREIPKSPPPPKETGQHWQQQQQHERERQERQQREALQRQQAEALRVAQEKEKREREQREKQERERQEREKKEKEKAARERQEREKQERERQQQAEQAKDASQVRRSFWEDIRELKAKASNGPEKEKKGNQEMSEYQKAKAERDALRERFESRTGKRQSSERGDNDYERERERER